MVTRYGFHGHRQYLVWIKGQKSQTADRIEAATKTSALIKFASRRGLKTTQCDGVWLKPGSPAALAYVRDRAAQHTA